MGKCAVGINISILCLGHQKSRVYKQKHPMTIGSHRVKKVYNTILSKDLIKTKYQKQVIWRRKKLSLFFEIQ